MNAASHSADSVPELPTYDRLILPGCDEMLQGYGTRVVVVRRPVAQHSLLRNLPRTESPQVSTQSPEQTEHCENGECIWRHKAATSVTMMSHGSMFTTTILGVHGFQRPRSRKCYCQSYFPVARNETLPRIRVLCMNTFLSVCFAPYDLPF